MMRRFIPAAALCLVLASAIWADDTKTGSSAAARPEAAALQMGQTLIAKLKESPGCLGVESGKMQSGKLVIFAFFENKKAVLTWYDSPFHQKLIGMVKPYQDQKHVALKEVPDGVPLMAVASISFDGNPAKANSKIPFSQIAIEVYTPMTAGLSIGGSFAPDAFRALQKPSSKSVREKKQRE